MANLPLGFDLRDLFRSWVFQLGNFCLPATAQHDIGTTTRHVSSDCHGRRVTRLCDDIRFAGMELGVQNVMFDACLGQLVRDHFRFFNGDSTHQHRLAICGTLFNIFNDRLNFFRFGHVHQIR